MKVRYASTLLQEEEIDQLIDYMYTDIFPRYFSEDEVEYFRKMKVLHTPSRHHDYTGTLKDAFEILSSLQLIIALIEANEKQALGERYKKIFERNVQILQQYHLHFPFTLDQFERPKKYVISTYTPVTNELLV
jgi:hypothetical protein